MFILSPCTHLAGLLPGLLSRLVRAALAPALGLLLLLALSLASAGRVQAATPPTPTIPSRTYELVATYGVVGDGSTDNTTAIQNALNAAKTAGGGTVHLAATTSPVLSGPLTIYANTCLQLDAGAVLKALPMARYTNASSHFLNVYSGATNVAFTGSGTIDGNGSDWWTAYNAGTISTRPRLVQVNKADTVLFSGLTFQNSPSFHIAFSSTNNVTITGVTISAPSDAPNTDGVDPAGSHYLITGCTISVGDDNIAVKPGSVYCADYTITNCTFGTGHGLSIGGQTNLGLDSMTVTNCSFTNTTSGLRMKADPTQGGKVTNVSYSDITMANVQYPIVIYSYYNQVGNPGSTSGSNQTTIAKVQTYNATPPNSLSSSTLPSWSGITIRNLTATRTTGSDGWSIIWGLPNLPVSDVLLDNVKLINYSGLEIFDATNVRMTNGTAANIGTLLTYNAQTFTQLPAAATFMEGDTLSFSATVAACSAYAGPIAPSYRWYANGVALSDQTRADGAVISGSSTASLSIAKARAVDATTYYLQVTSALDGWISNAFSAGGNAVVTATPSVSATLPWVYNDSARLTNLSTRSLVSTGNNVQIVGFVISGSASKQVLVRASGPSLANIGLSSGTAPDPALDLYDSSPKLLQSNDNWGTPASGAATLRTLAASVGAFAFTEGSKDAALTATLAPAAYTAIVHDTTSTDGISLVEVYEADQSSRLVNLSTRSLVGTGNNVQIAGFVIGGSGSKSVLIRAVGPSLSTIGLSSGMISDPVLELYNSSGTLLTSNDNWGDDSTAASYARTLASRLGAFALTEGSKDAALIVTLSPGAYTAMVHDKNSATGIGLIEVYEVR